MSVDVLPPARSQQEPSPQAVMLPESATSWAVGTLMATVPGSAHLAEQVLSAAATQACLPVTELAKAMVAGSRGTPLPSDVLRALDDSVQAARRQNTEPRRSGTYLMPTRKDAERALARFFDARVRLCAAPDDQEARRAVDDAVYTLCVLMGQPTPFAAVNEALQYTSA
ncbi:DUF5133 domain-containing protein [Streptomyces subrutilus]|nr:DUF5133 domain-containing protein [Streptomyces subrutilus]